MRALFFLAILALAGCSTINSRIKERPDVYQSLPEKQKSLVAQGQVTENMTRDAVYLAWGKPEVIWRGSENGQAVEDWTYLGSRTEIVPVYRPVLVSRGRHHSGWSYAFDPTVVSHQYPYQTVRFENGKAVAWRKTSAGY